MSRINRRSLLVGSVAALASPTLLRAEAVKPKVTVISQWSAGSDGLAITTLGKEFEKQGGVWEHNPVPGFTTEMMNKLRAQIIAGDPPAASQLKGPEIAAWSKIGAVVDLDGQVKEAGYEAVVPAELARLSKPQGHWIALPIQAYRINTLFISKKAADRVGVTKLPATWAEFNAIAEKMKAAGITPVANGGLKWDDGMKWEIALCGISPDAYRKAVMQLDDKALKGPEVLAAFRQFRKLGEWSDPGAAGQHYSTFLARYMSGEMGMLLMGGWAQGVFKHAGFQFSDYLIGPSPQDDGKIAFDLNSDEFIFWQKKQPEFQEGQKLLAKIVMSKDFGPMYSQITGSIPVRTDTDLSAEGFSDGQREAAQAMAAAVKANRVVLSLGHNMAQPNQITAAMIDVLTEFVHDNRITPEEGQKRLADAVDNVR
jgi:glucose/mannose transport system substrate-binding protein